MISDMSRIQEELAPFADLGTDSPQAASSERRLMIRMTRHGEELELQFDKGTGKVTERSLDDGQVQNHASYHSLLASDRFGNLRQWTNNQKRSLQQIQSAYVHRIPVTGLLSNDDRVLDVDDFDAYLVAQDHGERQSARVMLIDGPAGIGKTTFIEFLAWSRAHGYLTKRHPLILHVKSRGRILTYIQDLIAFSLQRLRLNLTFDQLPVLVRHGLVTLAIDGFDELADPNGYELAWSQVGELIEQVRGRGTLILAGRETFIGQDRIRDSIKSLRSTDAVQSLTLCPPGPTDARNWLQAEHKHEIEFPEDLFEVGSFALRPFFLVQLSQLPPESEFGKPQAGLLLASLVKAMIQREASRFEPLMTQDHARTYVTRFLREVARYMADDQTDAIDELALSWAAEMAASEDLDEETRRTLAHRAAAIVFLEDDDTPQFRRFSHSNLFNHFLGMEILEAVARRDLPKCIRRNVLGADFLAVFSDLTLTMAVHGSEHIVEFYDSASEELRNYGWNDRGAHNLGSLLLAILPSLDDESALILRNIHADEALIRGTAPAARLHGCTISQFDIQGANVESLDFVDSHITTLTVDQVTHVSSSIPLPLQIQYNRSHLHRNRVISSREEIDRWLDEHGRVLGSGDSGGEGAGMVPAELAHHPMLKVLRRACRSRSFWIPYGSTNFFEKFTRDPLWPDLLRLMQAHHLVRDGTNPASGTNSRFFHIKQPVRILTEDMDDDNVKSFYEELVAKMRDTA